MEQGAHEYSRDAFKRFLVDKLDMANDSASCYISYVNGIGRLLNKPIGRLAFDDAHYEKELAEVRLYGKRSWPAGLKALFRFFHDDQEPKSEQVDRAAVADDALSVIVDVDGNVIRDVTTPIFRYMDAERYYELIESRCLTLAHISHWEDPFEGFLYRDAIRSAVPLLVADRIYDKFKCVYGQSWTANGVESDVIWRAMAYGKRGNTVRVRTTVGKLARCIASRTSPEAWNHMRISGIKYIGDNKLRSMLENVRDALDEGAARQLDFLFFKREAFKQEEEVRVAILADRAFIDDERCSRGDLLRFDVEPCELVEEVLVDPCMDRRNYEQLVCRTRFAVPELHVEHIRRSELFDWPVAYTK